MLGLFSVLFGAPPQTPGDVCVVGRARLGVPPPQATRMAFSPTSFKSHANDTKAPRFGVFGPILGTLDSHVRSLKRIASVERYAQDRPPSLLSDLTGASSAVGRRLGYRCRMPWLALAA